MGIGLWSPGLGQIQPDVLRLGAAAGQPPAEEGTPGMHGELGVRPVGPLHAGEAVVQPQPEAIRGRSGRRGSGSCGASRLLLLLLLLRGRRGTVMSIGLMLLC